MSQQCALIHTYEVISGIIRHILKVVLYNGGMFVKGKKMIDDPKVKFEMIVEEAIWPGCVSRPLTKVCKFIGDILKS